MRCGLAPDRLSLCGIEDRPHIFAAAGPLASLSLATAFESGCDESDALTAGRSPQPRTERTVGRHHVRSLVEMGACLSIDKERCFRDTIKFKLIIDA